VPVALPLFAAWLGAGAVGTAPRVAVAPSTVVYGDRVVVTVTLPPSLRASAATVTATPLGGVSRALGSFGPGATRWRTSFRPRLRTTLRASAGGNSTAAAVVRVRPRVGLVFRRGVFVATVTAARSYRGRAIALQRRSHGRWVTVRRGVLRADPKRFRVALPPGGSTVRAYVPASAAEPGYAAGYSRAVVVRR
jgi:hypothetical protein